MANPDSKSTRFHEDGALCLKGAISPEWLEKLGEGFRKNISHPTRFYSVIDGPAEKPNFIMDYNAWRQTAEYEEFIRNSNIGEVVGHLVGADEIRFFQDSLLWSSVGQSVPTPWHQDQPYYEVRGRLYSVWIPLDPTLKGESLAVISGSHKWGKLFVPTDFTGLSQVSIEEAASLPPPFEPMIDIDSDPGKYRVLQWEMQPGDCIVFDGRAIHGRYKDRQATASLRRLTFRFVAEDAIWDPCGYPWSDLDMGHGDLEPGDRLGGDIFPLIWVRRGTPNYGQ